MKRWSVPDDYVDVWTPRIGPEAVAYYLRSVEMTRVGSWIAVVAWPVLWIGIGLSFWPVTVLGGLLLAFNFWVLFIYVTKLRGNTKYFARKFDHAPFDGPSPPFDRNPLFFDLWLKRVRERQQAREV